MKAILPKAIIVIFFSFIVLPVFGQKGVEDGSKYGHGQDSANCRRNLSLYKTYYEQDNYDMALKFWRRAFFECPRSSSNLHIHGINMFKDLYKETGDKAYIDTLEMIYDARIKYFNRESYYLGRKGMDIYDMSEGNLELVELAYETLEEAINVDPRNANPNALTVFFATTQMLFENEKIDNEEVINNYGMLMDILDERISQLHRPPDVSCKETVDMIFKAGGAVTCEGLIPIFSQRVADNPDDPELLNKVLDLLDQAGCTDSDLYYTAAENLYQIEKSAESAYHLAEMNYDKMNFDRAEEYYLEAVELEDDKKMISIYYTKLATLRLNSEDYRAARDYGKKAIIANPDNGTAYMIVGNAYSSVKPFDDELKNQMVYWVAADYFRKAKEKDPGLTTRVNEYIETVSQLFPKKEDLFFISIIEEGAPYTVGGWINETTTVRFRDEN
ncbi:MAG: tetratricopeptide repeat protein [Bacteroidota bacterium]|nr:tetratricopeptide repeat protein [Bacteroidota bacterium]